MLFLWHMNQLKYMRIAMNETEKYIQLCFVSMKNSLLQKTQDYTWRKPWLQMNHRVVTAQHAKSGYTALAQTNCGHTALVPPNSGHTA